MVFIKLDKTSLQTFITDLTSYAESVDGERSSCHWTLSANLYPTNIDSMLDSGSTIASRVADIKTHASDLQTRLDEAVAMNEDGVLMTNPDGTISYYLPDDVDDTAANVTAANSGAKDQAETDAEALQAFVDSGNKDEAKYQELLEKMQAHQNNPIYADSFIDTVGPENLAQLAVDVEDVFVDSTTSGNVAPKTSWGNTQHGDKVAQAFGYMLSAASSVWSPEESREAADAITGSLKDKPDQDWSPYNIKRDRLGAVNTMLGVSQAVDLDGDDSTTDHGAGMPFGTDFLSRMGEGLEGAPLSYDYFANQEGPHVGDMANPLSGLAHAMSANPEAARRWLAGEPGTCTDVDKTVSRIDEIDGLLRDRRQSVDGRLGEARRERCCLGSGCCRPGSGSIRG